MTDLQNATDTLNAIIATIDAETFEDQECVTTIMGAYGYFVIAFDDCYVFHKDGEYDLYITQDGKVDSALSVALTEVYKIIHVGGFSTRNVYGKHVLVLDCKNYNAPVYAIEDARETLDTGDFIHCFDGRSGGHLCLYKYSGKYSHHAYDAYGTDTALDVCNTIDSLTNIRNINDLKRLTDCLTSIVSQVESFKSETFDNDDYDPDTDPYEIEDDGTFGTEEE
jgi:hypothetical protein